MKQVIKTISFTMLAAALMAPASLLAQKEDKVKEGKEKKEAEQIIITRTGSGSDKVVVEIDGDKVRVNGKEIDKSDSDVKVLRTKIKDRLAFNASSVNSGFGGYEGLGSTYFVTPGDYAMLGVTTEKSEKGAEIQDVTKESGADKAGLKKGDVITKINDKKIEGPDDLSKVIKKEKVGEKVTVTYLRDNKEQKVTAELSKWKGVGVYSNSQNFNFDMGDMDFRDIMPRAVAPRIRGMAQGFSWSGGAPKLGLTVQDAEDGKGVSVLEVDEEGNAAKAGIKEDDVITEVDGKAVNSADEISKVMKESKDKVTVKMKLQRNGKSETVDVRIPKVLKTADL